MTSIGSVWSDALNEVTLMNENELGMSLTFGQGFSSAEKLTDSPGEDWDGGTDAASIASAAGFASAPVWSDNSNSLSHDYTTSSIRRLG